MKNMPDWIQALVAELAAKKPAIVVTGTVAATQDQLRETFGTTRVQPAALPCNCAFVAGPAGATHVTPDLRFTAA